MRLIDYIHQGGSIMYILMVLNVIGIALMATRIFILSQQKQKIPETSSLLGQKVKENSKGKNLEVVIELAKTELSTYMSSMEKGLGLIKSIATIAPLLGLLGTVVGILLSFEVISTTGVMNPANFAQGISLALITTVGGMIVAIPHYVGSNYISSYLDSLEVSLEKELLNKVL
jgi:biopolymer transport protein ExbB